MGKPKIRFKGYTDDWEQRKLEEVVEFLDTMRKPLEGAKRIPGPYPYYGASGIVDYVDGYLFDEELVLLSEDGANITDRNYPVCFLASGKYWVNNHAHVLRTKDGNENNFICNSLERKDYKQYNSGMAMPKLNQEVCRGIPISCPSFDEQRKIGGYFRGLDHLITLHQRKCEETKKLKKYMLQKMFPQDGQVVPEIRFKGFTDAWEQRKLGDILERRIEQRQQSEEYPRLAFASGQGVIPLSERKTNNREQLTKDEFTKKYLVTELDDIVYNPANVKYGAIDRNKCGRGLISPIYVTFTTSEIPGFIERIVTSYDFQQRALRFEEGTVTKRQSVNPEDLVTLDVLLPHQREEQKKVGAYFDKLDHLITLHQNKCNELQNMKKFMLKNMFV